MTKRECIQQCVSARPGYFQVQSLAVQMAGAEFSKSSLGTLKGAIRESIERGEIRESDGLLWPAEDDSVFTCGRCGTCTVPEDFDGEYCSLCRPADTMPQGEEN